MNKTKLILISVTLTISSMGLIEGETRIFNLTSAQESVGNVTIELITDSLVDNNGNLILAGQTNNDSAYIAKYERNGNLKWDKILGGSGVDTIETLLITSSNELIILGETSSTDFSPLISSIQDTYGGGPKDLFLTKISDKGDFQWSTYLGGNDEDTFTAFDPGIRIVEDDHLLINMRTWSSDLETSQGAFQSDFKGGAAHIDRPRNFGGGSDYFITKISGDGSSLWSTYMGGDGYDYLAQIVQDNLNNYIFYGGTDSSDFLSTIPNNTTLGSQPTFVVKLDPSGNNVWSTLIGGSDTEWANDILIDSSYNIIVRGHTKSPDYPVLNAHQGSLAGDWDKFFTKINEDGNIVWSTYLGGSGREYQSDDGFWYQGQDYRHRHMSQMLLDSKNDILFTIDTQSSDLSTSNAFQPTDGGSHDFYVGKFTSDGELEFGSYLGGGLTENRGLIFLDQNDNMVITGESLSNDYLTSIGSEQAIHGGGWDIVLTKISNEGDILFSTYFGGNGTEKYTDSFQDIENNIFVIGTTRSKNFPTTDNSTYVDGTDLFASKFDPEGNLIWSSILGGSSIEISNRFGLVVDNSGNSYILGTSSSDDLFFDNPDSRTVGFVSAFNGEGEKMWQTSIGNSVNIPNHKRDWTIIILIFISASVILVGSSLRFYFPRKSDGVFLNDQIDQILRPLFNDQASLSFLFVGQSVIKDKKVEENARRSIPPEIYDFKELFHPVKLSVIKLLYENIQLSSTELRELLGVTWGDYSTHVKALKKKGYVITEEKFVNGSVRQIVSLEPHTVTKFQQLKDILAVFLETTPNLDRYLELAMEIPKKPIDNTLYPDN